MQGLLRLASLMAAVVLLATPTPAAALFNNPCLGYAVCVDVKVVPAGGDSYGAGTVTGPEGLDCRIVHDQIVAGSVCEIWVRSLTGPSVTFWLDAKADTGSLVDCNGNMVDECYDSSFYFTSSQTYTDLVAVDAKEFLMTVSRSSADGATGTVKSSPYGIDCGLSCSAAFPYGHSVSITAVGDNGNLFTGWSGGGCHGTATCTITMLSDVNLTATFAKPVTLALDISRGGTVVSGAPLPATCDPAISNPCYLVGPDGMVLTLAAKPAKGYVFQSWGGACASFGSKTTCSLPLSISTNASATFATAPAATSSPMNNPTPRATQWPASTGGSPSGTPRAATSDPAQPSSATAQTQPGATAGATDAIAAAVATAPAGGPVATDAPAGAIGPTSFGSDLGQSLALVILGVAIVLFLGSVALFALSRRRIRPAAAAAAPARGDSETGG